jgi:hypothetical protein
VKVGGNSTPQSDAVRKDVVKQDQTVNTAKEETAGPKDNPVPQSETLVKDQEITDEGKQSDAQKNEDAPNTEKESDPNTDPEIEAKEVNFTLCLILNFSYHSLILANFLVFAG